MQQREKDKKLRAGARDMREDILVLPAKSQRRIGLAKHIEMTDFGKRKNYVNHYIYQFTKKQKWTFLSQNKYKDGYL